MSLFGNIDNVTYKISHFDTIYPVLNCIAWCWDNDNMALDDDFDVTANYQ